MPQITFFGAENKLSVKTDEKLQLEEAGGSKAILCALEIEKASFLVNCDANTKFPVVSLNKVFCLNTDN